VADRAFPHGLGEPPARRVTRGRFSTSAARSSARSQVAQTTPGFPNKLNPFCVVDRQRGGECRQGSFSGLARFCFEVSRPFAFAHRLGFRTPALPWRRKKQFPLTIWVQLPQSPDEPTRYGVDGVKQSCDLTPKTCRDITRESKQIFTSGRQTKTDI